MRSEHKKGKAARWRASDMLMRMMDEELKSGTPTALSPFSIHVLEAIAEAKREGPGQVGMRPTKVSPWRTGKRR